jgi:predicted NBD/HSP70 family sugar kinase
MGSGENRVATTTQLLRHINATRILRLLRRGAPLSRAEIARELALTRATVGNAMLALLDDGLVMEGPANPNETRVGRPGIEIKLDPSGSYALGIEIGMRSVSAVVVDLTFSIVARRMRLLGGGFENPDKTLAVVQELLGELTSDDAFPADRIAGMGVAIPGLVDNTGVVVNAPLLGWRHVPIGAKLAACVSDRWLLNVQNDAAAFAAAERAVSTVGDDQDILLVLLSEGVGGAHMRDGRVQAGSHGYACEIGHTIIALDGTTDVFEAFAGSAHFDGLFSSDQSIGDAASQALTRKDEPIVAELLNSWGRALAIGLTNAIHLLDPHRIVLGGPLAQFFPAVERQVKDLVNERLLLGFVRPEISVARTGQEGPAVGAAVTVLDTLFDLPFDETDSLTRG